MKGSSSIFGHFWPFLAILSPFLTIVGQFLAVFCPILDYSRLFKAIFLATYDHFCQFMVYFWQKMVYFWEKMVYFLSVFLVFWLFLAIFGFEAVNSELNTYKLETAFSLEFFLRIANTLLTFLNDSMELVDLELTLGNLGPRVLKFLFSILGLLKIQIN